MIAASPRADFGPVRALLTESLAAKAVMAALDLGIFDRLAGDGLDPATLAESMGLMPDRLEPLLGVLVAAGLAETVDGRYRNTPVASEFLVRQSPFYQGQAMALNMRFLAMVEDSIPELLAGAKANRAALDRDWALADVMEGTAQEALSGGLDRVVDCIAALPGFDGFREMCDIGGNHGTFTMGVLERNPNLRGTIFDLPRVAELSRQRCERMGFGDRVEVRPIDLREESLPEARYDLALASHVLYAFKRDLRGAMARIGRGVRPGGWFVSHHLAGRGEPGREMATASLELLTRLCGYDSHFIEPGELIDALAFAGFEPPRFQAPSGSGQGLIAWARKPE